MGLPHAEWQDKVKTNRTLELSKYIMEQYEKSSSALSAEDIDRWVLGWYMERFGKIPPMWLSRSRP